MRKLVEIPVHDNTFQTARPLNPNALANKNLFNKKEDEIKDIESFNKLLKEVIIRFDTDPSYYLKDDFKKLILLISRSIKYFYSLNSGDYDALLEKVEILKLKVESIGVITKEEIDSLFGDLETSIPPVQPAKKTILTQEVFDYAYWQKPGAKSGAKVLWTNTPIPSDHLRGYGADWGKFFVNNPSQFLLSIGVLHRVGDTNDFIGEISIKRDEQITLRILLLFETTHNKVPLFKECTWNDTFTSQGLVITEYDGTLKVSFDYGEYLKGCDKINICITVEEFFGSSYMSNNFGQDNLRIYKLCSSLNAFDWHFEQVESPEYICKYHKLKVYKGLYSLLSRDTWRYYERGKFSSPKRKAYVYSRNIYSKRYVKKLSRMKWVDLSKVKNLRHRIGVTYKYKIDQYPDTMYLRIAHFDSGKYQRTKGAVYKHKVNEGDISSYGTYIKELPPFKVAF